VSKIKPCPFCGSDPEVNCIGQVRCSDSKRISNRFLPTCDMNDGGMWMSKKQWNTRPVEDKLKTENKRLKTRIEKLHKIAEENTIGYEAIIESLRSENEKLKEKKGIK